MTLPDAFKSNLSLLRGQSVLVTGGAGFLGRAIVEQLVECGCRQVIVFDVALPQPPFASTCVKAVVGDLLKPGDLAPLLPGLFAVLHVASPSPLLKRPELFHSVNVVGTGNVIEACKAAHISRLVYTGSASCVFDGTNQRNYDETHKISKAGLDAYTTSKLNGENCVLNANDNSLFTCSIRPHGIYGPRDAAFLPSVARTAEQGKNKYLIGDNTNLVDFTYVENVAYAHLLAAVHLKPKSPVNGQAYFITNRAPVQFWEFVGRLMNELGYDAPYIALPLWFMKPVAAALQRIQMYVKLPLPPSFSVQAVNYAGLAHYYSCDKAARDFGYFPPIGTEEGVRRTIAAFQHLRRADGKITAENFESNRSNTLMYAVLALVLSLLVFKSRAIISWMYSMSLYSSLILLLHIALLCRFIWHNTSVGEPIVQFKESPDLSNKLVLVTGANKGIGYETALAFAGMKASVILACRDVRLANHAMQKIQEKTNNPNISVIQLDLLSFASVRSCVESLQRQSLTLDFLVHNAGVVIPKATTEDGHDAMLQCHHLSPTLMNKLLIERNILSPSAKICIVTSLMHKHGHIRFNDLEAIKSYNRFGRYNDTKLMQVASMFALQEQLDAQLYSEIEAGNTLSLGTARRTVVAVNPGAVVSDFHYHFAPKFLMKLVYPLLNAFLTVPLATGAWPVLYACVSREMQGVGGVYVSNCQVKLASKEARSRTVQRRLMEATNELLRKHVS